MLVSYGSVSIFASTSRALWKWQKKNQEGSWSKEQEDALTNMKEAAWKAPAIKFPVKGKLFIMRISTWADSVGTVLLQKNSEGKWIPVAYESSPLQGLDQNCPGHEKAYLEALWTVMVFEAFPLHGPVVLQSTHTLLLSTKSRNGYKCGRPFKGNQ